MDTITEQVIDNEEIEMPESPFQITMSLDKDFVRAFKRLSKKYGDQILHINGFAPDQLNFTGFIDNFIDTKTVADATIDGNANSGTKDIVTMQSDMKKPHTKLLSFNKIFYEMRKKYGVDHANKWLEDEWSGALYMHDAYNSSLVPYSYKGTEIIKVKYKEKDYLISFSQLYDLVEEPETLLHSEHKAYCKYTNDLFVWDKIDGKDTYTKVIRVIRKPKTNEFRFIKCSNGIDKIVTDNHPLITKNGDIEAKNALRGEELYTYPSNPWEGKTTELYIAEVFKDEDLKLQLKGKKIEDGTDLKQDAHIRWLSNKGARDFLPNKIILDEDLGYLIGIIITDGNYYKDQVRIGQKSPEIREHIFDVCEKHNLPYSVFVQGHGISIGASLFTKFITKAFLTKAKGPDKSFLPQILQYNPDFIKGIIAGMMDGDGTFPKDWDHAAMFKCESRTLLNQFSYMLRSFGFMVKGLVPKVQYEAFNKKLKTPRNFYGIVFNIYKDSMKINATKCRDRVYNSILEDVKKTSSKRYTYTYEEAFLYQNIPMEYDYDEYVYDISTETTHFICNNILSHNCYAYDLDQVATKGLFFVSRFKTDPPQHLETFNNHVLEFVSWTSNRQSGAVGLPSYLIYSYYFWKKDVEAGYCKDPERYRDQQFQKFIYDLNQPFLRISECAFTNISIFDREYIMGIFGGRQYPDGSFVIDYIEELIEYQKAFMRMVSKIRSRTMMTFPVLTYSLLFQNGKFVDEEFARWCNKHNMKWCDSNFFVGSDVTTLSNCCRLLSDTTKVKASGFINSIGGTSLRIGSVKVSTINLRRVALEANGDKNKFFKILKARTMLDIEVLDVVRGIIKRNIEKGLLPQYDFDLMNLDTQYNTIGVTALYECVNEFGGISEDEFGNKYYTDEGLKFATEVLDCIKEVKNNYEADYSINIEAVPAESANVKLCYKDNIVYPEKDKGYFIYSNQWIPLMEKCTLQEKIRLGSVLDNACEGGVIAHINLAGEFADEEQAWELLNYIASQGVIYFAYNKEISVCEDEHAFFGDTCPTCGKPKVDSYCRVVGFLTPKSSYSKERKREFDNRKWFSLNNDWM